MSNYKEALTLEDVCLLAPSAFALAPHQSRSDRYKYIPTANIITAMMKEGFFPFKASQSRCRDLTRKEFTKHMIRFRRNGDNNIAGTEVPEVVLINAHDGSSTYQLMAGIFRIVCENGLVVADSTIGSLKVMHKGNIEQEVIDGSYKILEDSRTVMNRIGDWKQLQLTDGEQAAFAESAHILRFGDAEGKVHTPITAAQLLAPRRAADNRPDLWNTFNRVQENVIKGHLHGVRRDNGRRRAVSSRAVNGIDQDVKLNRALWQLAERMAELKK